MAKTAFLFSGQGGQTPGMGRDLYDAFPVAREVYKQASDVLGYRVLDLNGIQLSDPQYAQPAVVTHSYACYMVAREKGLCANVLAGFSLGELTALAASEALPFTDAVSLARLRGNLILKATKPGHTATSVILGIPARQCENACATAEGYVVCAMYNSSEQTVIAGETKAVEQVDKKLSSGGYVSTLFQKDAVPLHTELMESSVAPMREAMSTIRLGAFSTPVLSNADAHIFDSGALEVLAMQMAKPLRWDQVCQALLGMEVERFIELGPGRTLTAFIRGMGRNVKTFEVGDSNGLIKLLMSR